MILFIWVVFLTEHLCCYFHTVFFLFLFYIIVQIEETECGVEMIVI